MYTISINMIRIIKSIPNIYKIVSGNEFKTNKNAPTNGIISRNADTPNIMCKYLNFSGPLTYTNGFLNILQNAII